MPNTHTHTKTQMRTRSQCIEHMWTVRPKHVLCDANGQQAMKYYTRTHTLTHIREQDAEIYHKIVVRVIME